MNTKLLVLKPRKAQTNRDELVTVLMTLARMIVGAGFVAQW